MKKHNKFSVILKFVFIVVILIMLLLVVQMALTVNNISRYNELSDTGILDETVHVSLSAKEKSGDFEKAFYDTVEKNPSLNDIESLYNISYIDRFEYYEDLIVNSSDEYDFFCKFYAFFQDIPSVHACLCYPEYSSLINTKCLNVENELTNDYIKLYTYAWNKIITDGYKNYKANTCVYTYVDGEYIYNTNSKYYSDEFVGSKLVSINGIESDDMVFERLSICKVDYDEIHQKPYRTGFVFNDRHGEQVEVTIKTANGDLVKDTLFMDVRSDMSYVFGYENNIQHVDSSDKHFQIHKDNNFVYVKINDFKNGYGEQLKDELKAAISDCSDIIIDIRDNAGGYADYFESYIYPVLFAEDLYVENPVYFINSKSTKSIYLNLLYRVAYNFSVTAPSGYSKYVNEYSANGYNNSELNIYILISETTCSAADSFAALVSDYDKVTLIGVNTGGEGLCGTMMMETLPSSKLTYTFMPSVGYNMGNQNNSVIGTAPDIYVELSKNGFLKRNSLDEPYTYENRLLWDDALITAIKVITEER